MGGRRHRICGKRLKAALPSMVESLERHGHLDLDRDVRKRYSKPATPCDRLLARDDVSEERKRRLRQNRAELDPVSLLHSIRESQSALAAVGLLDAGGTPDGESLESFLSQLPDLWRKGEVRATHTRKARGPRSWRTRPDLFEGVWCQVLGWLSAAAGHRGGGADGSADTALPGALQQTPVADATAQNQPVARCDGETTGVCFSRK